MTSLPSARVRSLGFRSVVCLSVAAGLAGLGISGVTPRAGAAAAPPRLPSTEPALRDVKAFGNAKYFGSTSATSFNAPIVGMARTKSAQGYWEAATDGAVYSFGDAHYYGSMGGTHLNQPIVAIASTPTGNGYWLAASDGGIFTFGDAHFYGSTGGTHLNAPVVAFAPTPSGKGYRLAARDGGVFGFGYTRPHGVFPGRNPIVGMSAALPGDIGFWLVDNRGNTFAVGIPHSFANDTRGISKPVVGIVATPDGKGYWIVGRGSAPSVPAQVVVRHAGHSGGSGEIEVTWDAVPGATEYDVARSSTAAGPFYPAASVSLTTGRVILARGVTNLWSYLPALSTVRRYQYVEVITGTNPRRYYQVTASNHAGSAPPSATVCGTPIGSPNC